MAAKETAEAILLVIKRLAKWAAWGLLGLVGIGTAIALAVSGYEKWQNRPQIVSSLKGIGIGDKWADVVFKQGEFKVQPDTGVKKYQDEIDYVSDEKRVGVSVRNGVVTVVRYFCKTDIEYTELNGVRCGASGDEILKRFGDKVRVLCEKKVDESKRPVRVYDVVDFGTRYGLSLNTVEVLLVADKEELRTFVGLNFDLCK